MKPDPRQFDHPHIVPVFDVGRTDLWTVLCRVQSSREATFAARIEKARPGFTNRRNRGDDPEALHHAILMAWSTDNQARETLIDAREGVRCRFGARLKDEDFGQGCL